MIPNLVPIETYSVDETGYWKRLPLVVGVMMMVMGTPIIWSTIGDSLQPIEVLERGIAGGAGGGILFTFLLRRWAKRSIENAIAQSRVAPGTLFFKTGTITFLPQLAQQSHLSVEIPSATVAVSMERRPRNV